MLVTTQLDEEDLPRGLLKCIFPKWLTSPSTYLKGRFGFNTKRDWVLLNKRHRSAV